MTDTTPADWHRDLGPRWLWHQWPDGALVGDGCEPTWEVEYPLDHDGLPLEANDD